jgi:hypothetical protein
VIARCDGACTVTTGNQAEQGRMKMTYHNGAYYLIYKQDGDLFVIYYYHGMAHANTCSIWRVPAE